MPLPWYPLTHINHFTVINRRSAATPNHFAAVHLRQNSLVSCGAVFLYSKRIGSRATGLQFFIPALLKLHEPSGSGYRAMTLRKTRVSRTTPLQHRGRNADSVQAVTTSKRHFYCNLYFQLWKPRFNLKSVFSFWTEKAISKYRPVAAISKIEIASHIPVVLVGECLPQTLLPYRAVQHTPESTNCPQQVCADFLRTSYVSEF